MHTMFNSFLFSIFFGKIRECQLSFQQIITMLNFNLQTPSFSDEEDDEDPQLPSSHLMHQYNREYSLILTEVQVFLKQCKESVQRFVTLHNFGANFNLAHLLTSLHFVDQALALKTTAPPPENPRTAAKHTYEQSFNRLMHRMASLLADILDCEVEFKQKYFGLTSQAACRRKPHLNRARSINTSSIKSLSKSSSSSVRQWRDDREEEREAAREAERQAELRSTLNERLKLRMPKVEAECKVEFSTTENLYRLNQKIERMVADMRAGKDREKKLIELFNLNRTKSLPHPDPPAPSPSLPSNATATSDHEEVDEYLDRCRRMRKDSDSYSQANNEGRNFSKKQRWEE